MPLWEIFHSVAAFAEPHAKAWLAGNITELYVAVGLPAFYVNVFFHELSGKNLFLGGIPAATSDNSSLTLERPFVRLSIQHIAVHNLGRDEAVKSLVARLDKVLQPHIEEKGYDWEYSIIEPDRDLWRINGIAPPAHGSKEEEKWAKDGRPSPY